MPNETTRFDSPVLRLEADQGVATVWLARPDARNAMGPEFWRDLPLAMAAVSADAGVRAVVVAAEGAHFSVGLDLRGMAHLLGDGGGNGDTESGGGPGAEGGPTTPATSTASPAARALATRAELRRLQDAINAVARCPKPVIGAVHGYCIGAGVDLVAACDIRLASPDALFSVREAKMAIVADLGSLQRLPRIIGKGQVAELAYTGKDVSAARALEIGLVNDVLPDAAAALDAARALAGEIAANSPLAVQGTKAVLAASDGRTVGEGLDYVATWNAGFLQSDDLAEAMIAFMEKRPPNFTGR